MGLYGAKWYLETISGNIYQEVFYREELNNFLKIRCKTPFFVGGILKKHFIF